MICLLFIFLVQVILDLPTHGTKDVTTYVRSSAAPKQAHAMPCCVDLERDVSLDQGSDLDLVTIERARHNPQLLVASLQERFFYSSDAGETWKETTFEGIDPLGYGMLPPHPNDERVMYRIVETARSDRRYLLERSGDGGLTWIRKDCLLQNTTVRIDVNLIRYHPTDVNTIFAYGGSDRLGDALSGIYVSTDGGESFVCILTGTEAVEFQVSRSDPNTIYALNIDQSVVKSVNRGKTWHLVRNNDAIRSLGHGALLNNRIYQLVVDPGDPNVVYLVSKKGIIRSNDGGSSWCNLNLGDNINTAIRYMALSPEDSSILFAGTTRGLFRSEPGGCGWKKIDILGRIGRKPAKSAAGRLMD